MGRTLANNKSEGPPHRATLQTDILQYQGLCWESSGCKFFCLVVEFNYQVLDENKIRSVPLINSEQGFEGIVDVVDIAGYALATYKHAVAVVGLELCAFLSMSF